MQPAQTFGRRGVVAPAPAPLAPRPSAPRPQPQREELSLDRGDLAHIVGSASRSSSADRGLMWILFSFQGRLSPGNYRLVRIVVNIGALAFFWGLAQYALQPHSRADLGLLLLLLLVELVSFPLWLWVTAAMQIKRWHDRDKAGVWMLVGFIPLIGPLWTLIELMFLEGTIGPNRFGPSPKGDPTAVAFEA